MEVRIKAYLRDREFYILTFLIGLIIFAFSTVKLDMLADEGHVLNLIKEHENFWSYITWTYQNLNGRIFANTLMYFFLKYNLLLFWRLLSITALLSIAYCICRFFGQAVSLKRLNITLLLVFCLGYRVLSSSMLWFTGAIFYLWPIAMTLYLLVAVSDSVYLNQSIKLEEKYGMHVLLGILVMLWSEQAALVLLGFIMLRFIHSFLVKRKLDIAVLLNIVIWITFFLLLVLAPSQSVRASNSSIYGYAVLTNGIVYFLENGVFWTFKSIFYEQRILVLLLGIITIVCVDKQKRSLLLSTFVILLPGGIVPLIISGLGSSAYADFNIYIYGFECFAGTTLTFTKIVPYLYWTVYTFIMIALILLNIRNRFTTGIIILASIATLVVMWFSPTMYASGNRTCLLFCIGLIILALKLMDDTKLYCTKVMVVPGLVNFMAFAIWMAREFIIYY